MSMIDFHSLAKTELHCHLDGSLLTSLLAMKSSNTMSLPLPTVRISWTIWRPLITFALSFKPGKP